MGSLRRYSDLTCDPFLNTWAGRIGEEASYLLSKSRRSIAATSRRSREARLAFLLTIKTGHWNNCWQGNSRSAFALIPHACLCRRRGTSNKR